MGLEKALSPVPGVLMRRGKGTQRHTGSRTCADGAEMGMICPQVRGHQRLLAATRS